MTDWLVHPAADLFPMLADDELKDLADDIRANGLHEPVWVWDEPTQGRMLLDGRNRLAACKLAGVTVTTRVYAGDDPVSFVISENVKRRHLTEGQKANIALRAEPLYAAQTKAKEAQRKSKFPELDTVDTTVAGRPQSLPNKSDSKPAPKSRDKAAKTAGTSGRSVARMKRITKDAPDRAARRCAVVPSRLLPGGLSMTWVRYDNDDRRRWT